MYECYIKPVREMDLADHVHFPMISRNISKIEVNLPSPKEYFVQSTQCGKTRNSLPRKSFSSNQFKANLVILRKNYGMAVKFRNFHNAL